MTSKLTLRQSIPLGIGSILGSGVLFLPSLTYKIALNDVMISWLLIILLCIPGVLLFSEMLKGIEGKEASMASLVQLGLGKEIANSTYVILLGTVIFGMPSAAIIAGKYVAEVIPFYKSEMVIPFLLIGTSFLINFFGIKSSSRAASVITVLLLIISVTLIALTTQEPSEYKVLTPSMNLGNIYEGAVLAFWAFAGFENLTFMYDQFKNPRRDLIITILVSIVFCGLIYILLVANYAALIPITNVNDNIGLLQLAKSVSSPILIYVISIFAFFAVLINFISWTVGIVQLMEKSVRNKVINENLIYCFNSKKSPLYFLYTLFIINTILGLASPQLFESILKIVSSNFLILYALLISSYVFYTKVFIKKVISTILVAILILTISSSGILLIYPLILFMIAIITGIKTSIAEDDL